VLNPERTNVAHVIEMVAHHRPTVFLRGTDLLRRRLAEAERPGHRAGFFLDSMCVSAGEALPAEIFNAWKRQFASKS